MSETPKCAMEGWRMMVVVASTDDEEQVLMANKGFSSIGQSDEEEEAGRRRSADSLVDCAVLGDKQASVPKCVGSSLTAVFCRVGGSEGHVQGARG